jgi:hypothetical protein
MTTTQRAQQQGAAADDDDDHDDDSRYNQLARTKRGGQGWTRGAAAQEKVT